MVINFATKPTVQYAPNIVRTKAPVARLLGRWINEDATDELKRNTKDNGVIARGLRLSNRKDDPSMNYINLLERQNKVESIQNMYDFEILSMYFENKYNLEKLKRGDLCVLSYKKSTFARKDNIPLLQYLDRCIKSYFDCYLDSTPFTKRTGQSLDTMLGLFRPKRKSPTEVFAREVEVV